MLKQRVITAVLLLAILLPALFYPDARAFMAVALVLITLAGWEWGKLNGLSPVAAWLAGASCLLVCLEVWAGGLSTQTTPRLWLAVGGAWVLGGALLLSRGVVGWPALPKLLRVGGGVLMLAIAWLALAQSRVLGVNFLLSVLCLVWAADIGAYFVGRAWGQRKLAPSISPGKSWEGVWGGMVAVVALALGWSWADNSAQAGVPSRLR